MAKGNPVPALVGAGVVVVVGILAMAAVYAVRASGEPDKPMPALGGYGVSGLFEEHCVRNGARTQAVVASAVGQGFTMEPSGDGRAGHLLLTRTAPNGAVQQIGVGDASDGRLGQIAVQSQRVCMVSDLSQAASSARLDVDILDGLTVDEGFGIRAFRFTGAGGARRDLNKADDAELMAALAAGEVHEINWVSGKGLAVYSVSSGVRSGPPVSALEAAPAPAASFAALPVPGPAPAPLPPPLPAALPASDTAQLFLDLCYGYTGSQGSLIEAARRKGFIADQTKTSSVFMVKEEGENDFYLSLSYSEIPDGRLRLRSHRCSVTGPASGAKGRTRIAEFMAPEVRPVPKNGGDRYVFRDGLMFNLVDLGRVSQERLDDIWMRNDFKEVEVDAQAARLTFALYPRADR